MSAPSLTELYAAIEATWPPASNRALGPFVLRDGAGGGKRVSAATLERAFDRSDLDAAEAAMGAAGDTPLFMIRADDTELDAALAERGYDIVDPVHLFLIETNRIAVAPPRLTTFKVWPPLRIAHDIWEAGGIGPARLDVMARAEHKTSILARHADKPAGVAFAAAFDGICMVHAVEVAPAHRRQKVAVNMMRDAACWAQDMGCGYLCVLATRHNVAATGLYRSMGFEIVGHYHYRMKSPKMGR